MQQDTIESRDPVILRIDALERRIFTLLQGNPDNPEDKGVLGKTANLSLRVKKLEKWKDRTTWVIVGAAFGSGSGITLAIKTLFFKN